MGRKMNDLFGINQIDILTIQVEFLNLHRH